jgi:hypothetical protein
MTDYLINQYNDKIAAALKSKDDAIAAATQLWNRAVEEIVGAWQAASAAAAIELTAALEHRNRVYVEGPPAITVNRVESKPFVIDDELGAIEVGGQNLAPGESMTFVSCNGAWQVSDIGDSHDTGE